MNKNILKHILRYILMILIIFICSIIFGFSADSGEESGLISARISRAIVMIDKSNRELPEEEIQAKVDNIHPYVRKCAHFSIYLALGMSVFGCLLTFKGKRFKQVIGSIVFTYFYACTDELHQRFVVGRSGEFKDVLIDTLGAFVGIITLLVIYLIVKKIKESKTQRNIDNKTIKQKKKSVIFIASTGGHLHELMQFRKIFRKYNYQIITEKTEVDVSFKEKYRHKLHFLIYGTKKYPIRYIFKFSTNCIISLVYFFRFQPDVIVTTGTHTAVPMCYIGKIFGAKIIFIETFANRETKTVAGKMIYPIADTFVVQWEEMLKLYPKAVCWGWVY